MKTASSLLADNYRAQDRKRLIRCIELLDEATKSIDGGMWIGEEREESRPVQTVAAPAQAPRPSSLIARESAAPVAAAVESNANGA